MKKITLLCAMHQNWLFLQNYCSELQTLIQDAVFTNAYSNSNDELVLVFKTTNESYIGIKCLFLNGIMHLFLSEDIPNPGNRAQYWFKPIHGRKVNQVRHNGRDRSFFIDLDRNNKLLFKFYGRMGNVVSFNKKGIATEIFRTKHSKDLEIDPTTLNKKETLIWADSLEGFKKENRHLPPAIASHTFDRFKSKEQIEKDAISYLKELSRTWGLIETEKGWDLDIFGEEFPSALTASNKLISNHFSKNTFITLKEQQTAKITKEVKKLESKLAALKSQKEKAKNRKSHKEVADIIMANLHVIEKRQEEATLFDFYENKEITIKLNPKLSPQDYASRLYKKSKNQSKETEVIEQNIKESRSLLKGLEEQLEVIQDTNSTKGLKKMAKPIEEQIPKNKVAKPYWEKEIDGVAFWIGKGAKQNDALLKLTHKEEWWFHAKDVAGSHCVAKTRNELSKNQLEKMCAIAAYYSKAKSQSLAPVIYTKRKYVRKPKGFLPGKVIVEKESVILIEPAREI